MAYTLADVTMALAGMLQAISLIRELGQEGTLDDTAFQSSIYSIFQMNAPDVPTIYKNVAGLKNGLAATIMLLSQPADPLQQRYLLSLIHLQKKLAQHPKMLSLIDERLAQADKQVAYFSLTHPTVIANLADLYQATISTFNFRVIILGNERILSVAENIDKVRALLLAGIRATILWRQVGGSRLHLLFSRKKILDTAIQLLNDLNISTKQDLT